MSKETVVVTAVTKAAKSLSVQVTALTKAMGELQVLQAMVPELSDEISMKTAELAQIEADTKETLRKAKAELNLQILENEDKVLATLLTKQKKANITQADLDDLQERLVFAENESSEQVKQAVTAKAASMSAEHGYKLKDMESAHKVETATLSAELAQLRNQISFLTQANSALEKSLEAERAARIETAKYSQPIINTGSTTGR